MGQVTEPQESKYKGWLPLAAVILIIFIFLFGLFFPQGGNWLVVMALMIAFVAVIGKLITNRWFGILINERKKMSLSRFQLVLWTLIVLSAFSTIALERIYAKASGADIEDPLAIEVPPELWALLGISTASFVGSPLILGAKVPQKLSDKELERGAALRAAEKTAAGDTAIDAAASPSQLMSEFNTLKEEDNVIYLKAKVAIDACEAKLTDLAKKQRAGVVPLGAQALIHPDMKDTRDSIKEAKDSIKKARRASAVAISKEEIRHRNIGPLDFNQKIDEAKFANLFTGDEIANRGFVDMAKVQKFFFTLIIALSYMVLLANLIWTTDPAALTSFPQLEQGTVALLGISSAGYLTSKVPGKK